MTVTDYRVCSGRGDGTWTVTVRRDTVTEGTLSVRDWKGVNLWVRKGGKMFRCETKFPGES